MSRSSKILIIVALIFYTLSVLVQLLFPVDEKPFKYQTDTLIEWQGDSLSVPYLQFGDVQRSDAVIMVPDPFTPTYYFEEFSKEISGFGRVIVPLFPSEDISGNRISHSPEARAAILEQMLDSLGVRHFDLIGHGFGNAAAIRLLENRREGRVRSYSMISALGVQEFHFLGYHVLNQPIYSVLFPVGWLIEHGLPIAHWNRNIPINLKGARFLYAMDQRPYRDILMSLEMPVHIIHSEQDRQISVNTAREHHRIIPQSSITVTQGDHSAIYDRAESWAADYLAFVTGIENGDIPNPPVITPERQKLADQPFNFSDVPPVDGWAFFMVILLLSIVTLVSEDLGCIGAGLLAAGNVITFLAAFTVIFMGILIADTGIYWMGRIFGRPVIQRAPFRWLISRKDIDWTATLFKNNGIKIMFGSRFLPGTRFPTYFSAGVLQTSFPKFFLYFFLSILIWTPLVLGTSILVGQQMLDYLQIYQEYAIQIFFILVLVIYLGFKLLVPLSTRKGRKELAVYFIRLKQRLFKR